MSTHAHDILNLPFAPLPELALGGATYIDDMRQIYDPFSSDPVEANLPATTAAPPLTPWPTRLPIDLAMGVETHEQVLLRHGVSAEDYQQWAMTLAFRRVIAEAAKEVRDNGLTFKRMCAAIAEDFLGEIDAKLHDPELGFVTKMDTFKTVAKLGGLEPKEDKAATSQNANMVNIQINL